MVRLKFSGQKNFHCVRQLFVAAIIAVGLTSACVFAASPEAYGGKHIIGYFPDWASDFINKIDYNRITHINYFSIEPYSDGFLNTNNINAAQLTQVVQAANAAGVTVSISVGGYDRCSGFPGMAANPASRSNFIQKIAAFMTQYNLSGIDLNWEPINSDVEKDNYSTLIEELRAGLGSGKLLSVAVSPQRYDIREWAVDDLNWVEVMAYDMNWPYAAHSTYEDAIKAMSFWEVLLVPKDKLMMGLPFYGRNDNSDAQTYSWIVDTYNPLSSQDFAGGYGFNGIDTIQAKTAYVYDNNYGGVMIWNLSQDKQDQRSLLAAIISKASEYVPPSPNPMTWAEAPSAAGDTSVSMTATTAADPNGVEYYFACVSGQPEGTDSGWQDGPSYTDNGLMSATIYSYRVKARDKSAKQNETNWSEVVSATTTGTIYPRTLHVDSISLSIQNRPKGLRAGKATVVIKNDLGGLVPSVGVKGVFTGSFNEQSTVITDSNGCAVFVTAAQVKNPSFTFRVDGVTHATLEYNPVDNLETSESR